MDMGGIAREEDAPDLIAIGEARIHDVHRGPGHGTDAEIGEARSRGDHRGETVGGKIDLAFQRNGRLQLEERGALQRAE